MSIIEDVRVRHMLGTDMGTVVTIDRDSFDRPLGYHGIRMLTRGHNRVGMVAVWHDNVVGYSVHEVQTDAYAILRIAVNPDWRREGIGRRLVQRVVHKLTEHERERLVLDVPEPNLGAQLFCRAVGLRAVGIVQGEGRTVYRFVRTVQECAGVGR